MRLGGFFRPETLAELEACVERLDVYGLSTIRAPQRIVELSDEEAVEYGDRALELGIVVGEAIPHVNLMTRDAELRAARIEHVRESLRKCELMRCHGAVILVGTVDPADALAAPHPYLYTDECRAEFRDVVLRCVDGLELRHAKLLIEPWPNSFFYRPRSVLSFLESVDHPRVALHLDQMNMVDQDSYFHTTDLINETFDLLAPYIGGAHFKDVLWDWSHMLLKLDEVLIGDGVLDYETYLRRLCELPGDVACFCEHLATEAEYAVNFERLHRLAAEAGFEFTRRTPVSLPVGTAG